MKNYLLLFCIILSSCTSQQPKDEGQIRTEITINKIDTICYKGQDGVLRHPTPIEVLDIQSLSSHEYIANKRVEAVAKYNDTLIVITNDQDFFIRTCNNADSIRSLYPDYSFVQTGEDCLLHNGSDTLIFYPDSLWLIEASLLTDNISIGGLKVGMTGAEVTERIGLKMNSLPNSYTMVVLSSYQYVMHQNAVRSPSLPRKTSYYDRIILIVDKKLKNIQISNISNDEKILSGPYFWEWRSGSYGPLN